MTRTLGRRDFLVGSAVLAGTAVGGGFACVEFASATPIEVPVVDKLSIKILVDSTHNLFLRPRDGQRRERAANPRLSRRVSQCDLHPMGPVALARIPAQQ